MSKKIGFIGIGLMGLPMAKNILKSGFNLKAFNRSQNKAEPLKEFGAEGNLLNSIDVSNNINLITHNYNKSMNNSLTLDIKQKFLEPLTKSNPISKKRKFTILKT